jgi:hypothetical protein
LLRTERLSLLYNPNLFAILLPTGASPYICLDPLPATFFLSRRPASVETGKVVVVRKVVVLWRWWRVPER